MKDLKGGIQGSLFPVKLFISYVLLLTFLTGLIDGPVACLFGLGWPHPDDFAASFAMMLALSPALLVTTFLALGNFRRMPFFSTLSVSLSIWLSWIIWRSYWPSFDNDFPNYFDMWGLLSAAVVYGAPFIIVYFVWRFWPQRRSALPAA